MPKEFYTERDIEDMFKRGSLSLQVNDNVVLTELAYEKAKRLGVQLLHEKPLEPPGAPVRPYISEPSSPSWGLSPALPPRGEGRWLSESRQSATTTTAPANPAEADLPARIRAAVNARLGTQVDPALLDVIIERVLKSTGAK
jgi:hypothetical protein